MSADRCGVRHAPIAGDIEVRDPDDEIVAHGAFIHVERLDRHVVWLSIQTPNGQRIAMDLVARAGGRRLDIIVRDEGDTPTHIPEVVR